MTDPRIVGLRDELTQFSQAMEKELRLNDDKDHWINFSHGHMLRRLKQEVRELDRALKAGESVERVLSECADVANFAMMVSDCYRQQVTDQ